MLKKTLCALLALLTVLPMLAACSNIDGSSDDTTSGGGESVADTTALESSGETGRANAKDSLPSDLDFKGETVTFFYRDVELVEKGMMEGENNGGDVLYDAVYARNQVVMERLNVDIKFKKGPTETSMAASNNLRDEIPKYILSGEADWDALFLSSQFGFTQHLVGYYVDLMDFPYIDYAQPWWWEDYMLETSIDSHKRYQLNGDITTFALMSATAAFFNKDMFTNKFGDTSELYALVDDGIWTVDRYLEYCAGAYEDVNGDGQRDDEDIFGARHTSHFTAINYLTLSNGVSMYSRDDDGLPVLDLYNDTWVNWTDNIVAKYMTDEYSMISIEPGVKTTEQYFISEKSLFSMGMLYNATQLRETDFIYGIVPFPKYNENYDYLSAGATPNAEAIFIPVTTATAKYDAIGATLEAMCAETYRNVTEIYYETTLKGKYADSENDIRMVDTIYNSIGTNFVMVAGVELGQGAISSIFAKVYYDKTNLSSYYEANREKFEQMMVDMIEKYQDLEV